MCIEIGCECGCNRPKCVPECKIKNYDQVFQAQLFAREVFEMQEQLRNIQEHNIAVAVTETPIVGDGSEGNKIRLDWSTATPEDICALSAQITEIEEANVPEEPQIAVFDSNGCITKSPVPTNLIQVNEPLVGSGSADDKLDIDFSKLDSTNLCQMASRIPDGVISYLIGLEANTCTDDGQEWCPVKQELTCSTTDCPPAHRSSQALACISNAGGAPLGMGIASVFESMTVLQVSI